MGKMIIGVGIVLLLAAVLLVGCVSSNKTTDTNIPSPAVVDQNIIQNKVDVPAPVVPVPVKILSPKVTIQNQNIVNSGITFSEVDATQAGWVVIYRDVKGGMGAVIGYAPVQEGANKDVVVKINECQATSLLHSSLNVDANQIGVFEFPGVDAPVDINSNVVSPIFNVLNLTGIFSSACS